MLVMIAPLEKLQPAVSGPAVLLLLRSLRSQISEESLLSLIHEIPVALWIDERIRRAFLHARQLLFHSVIRSVRPQIHVAVERFQHPECAREIFGNVRV